MPSAALPSAFPSAVVASAVDAPSPDDFASVVMASSPDNFASVVMASSVSATVDAYPTQPVAPTTSPAAMHAVFNRNLIGRSPFRLQTSSIVYAFSADGANVHTPPAVEQALMLMIDLRLARTLPVLLSSTAKNTAVL